jgi:hypothetical protein
MKMHMSVLLDKAKPGTEDTRGLNLVAVGRVIVQVTKLTL